MRKIELVNDGYYHIFNRGVDKRTIFEDQDDYQRFYQSLYLFNDANYSNPGNQPYFNETLLAASDRIQEERDQLIKILAFCLLPNHFHLFVKQIKDNGIAKFFQKLGIGYVGYFNRKVERSGRLFETTYKKVSIDDDAQFMHLPRYIHLNALDLTPWQWRDGLVSDWGAAKQHLANYPWSSHSTYLQQNQRLPVIDEPEIRKIFPRVEDYLEFLKEWSTRDTLM